mgnify:FL=1
MSMNRRVYVITKKKKKRIRLRNLILTPLLLFLLTGTAYFFSLYSKAEEVANSSYESLDGSELDEVTINKKAENISVLFIGVDDSETREGPIRSDAIMLATFNKEDNSVKLLSIPRDSYVYVPETDKYTKINHAYAYGGTKATIETVENLLELDVDYYIRMNFYAFIDVVDALGGVKVDVPYNLVEKNSSDLDTIQLKEGIQTLNGEEALAFARTRKMDNDMERGKRQQELIEAIMSKATSAQSLSKYSKVLEAIGDNMKTDLTFTQMKVYLSYFLKHSDLSIDSIQLQGADSTINGVYYYELDEDELEATKDSLQAHLDGTTLSDETATTTNETINN